MSFQLNLDTEPVPHAYPSEPLCVASESLVSDVLDLLNQKGRGSVLVLDQDRLAGIFTERDALRMMALGEPLDVPIGTRMTAAPVTVSMDETVGQAIAKMSAGGYRHLPMVDASGRPTGVVSVAGILRYLVEHFPKIVYTLPPSPHHTTQEREGA